MDAPVFVLNDKDGFRLVLSAFGAAVRELHVPLPGNAPALANGAGRDAAAARSLAHPVRGGHPGAVDVVLGYGDDEGYLRGGAFHGGIVGRFANRIAGGEFTLGGTRHCLTKNQDGRHTLHGGRDFWDKRLWQAEQDPSANSVLFRLRSQDGDQGFPGNADISVRYTLCGGGRVKLHCHAVSDSPTVFSLTNHAYFNLDGCGAKDISGHLLRIAAGHYLPTDQDLIPTGEARAVDGTAFDFRAEKPIGRDIGADDRDLLLAGGYDHCFVLGARGAGEPAAVATSMASGLRLSLFTDMPGLQFYSGNALGGEPFPMKDGMPAARRSGFCLETQMFPDAPHHPRFPSAVFGPGRPFESETVWAFSHACRASA